MQAEKSNKWRERRAIAEQTRAILVERFPRCFCAKGAPKRPLKIGIHKDIRNAAPDLPREHVFFALHDYTTGRTYRRQLLAGATRFDLDGWPAGEVTASEAAEAAEVLKRQERISAANQARKARDAEVARV